MLDKVVGQDILKRKIEIAIQATRHRQEPLGHILLSGAGGLGKTHILNAICDELGYFKAVTQGNRLSTPNEVQAFFINNCKKENVSSFLIIDEIHEIPLKCQEEFYYPIDHGSVITQAEPIHLGAFTIAGATTCPENLDNKSLINRFVYHWKVEELDEFETVLLVNRYLIKRKIRAEGEVMWAVAKRSRGVPRLALKYAGRIRDYAHAEGRNEIVMRDVNRAFSELGIDDIGLDEQQRKYLKILYESGKPIGIDALASMLDEARPEQVKKMIEPYLWKLGMITSTTKGRELTNSGHKHIMQTCGLAAEL